VVILPPRGPVNRRVFDRLASSAIHAWTARSTAPLVTIRTGTWPREGTTRFRQPARYGSNVLASRPRRARGITESP
jgi:hypothetical protein